MNKIPDHRNVNQKALDQYVNFTEQRQELTQRQAENSKGEAKIKQLIQTLDLRKDEAIERTFKVNVNVSCWLAYHLSWSFPYL